MAGVEGIHERLFMEALISVCASRPDAGIAKHAWIQLRQVRQDGSWIRSSRLAEHRCHLQRIIAMANEATATVSLSYKKGGREEEMHSISIASDVAE